MHWEVRDPLIVGDPGDPALGWGQGSLPSQAGWFTSASHRLRGRVPAFHTALGRGGRFHKGKGSCWGEGLEELGVKAWNLTAERDKAADKNLKSSGS